MLNLEELKTFCYIQEQTSFDDDYKNNFGFQVHDRGSRFFLTFDAILQSFGVKNRNGREYDADNIMDRILHDEYIQDQLSKNCWMGEIDHPAAIKQGEELTMQRIANPDPKLTSHYIRRPRLNGNLLEAGIQTDSSNENGMNMAIKIVDGKIIPCFSARVLGELKNLRGRLIVFVRKLITYDWVLYPSHREAVAKINQPMIESVCEEAARYAGCKIMFLKDLAQQAANNSFETQLICESFGLTIDDVVGLTSTGNSIVINEGSNVYIQPISDKFVRERTKKGLTDWINS